MSSRASLVSVLLLLSCGSGCGRGPGAMRVSPDTNSRYLPKGAIHFVEQGRRATGVIVSATEGGESAFSVSWTEKLVPTSPGVFAGPVWTGGKVRREQAVAIARLPAHRDEFQTLLYGDILRERLGELTAWVVGTDPFILGLGGGGKPLRSWREFARQETGMGATEPLTPLKMFTTRYVVDGELEQPLARLVVFPKDFWTRGDFNTVTMDVVTLPRPMSIDDVLDALAEAAPTRLGELQAVKMETLCGDAKDIARKSLDNRERQLNE